MGKYDPLKTFLKRTAPEMSEVTISFERTEEVLGAALPHTARTHREWWGNEKGRTRHVQARAWLSAGWEVDTVDLHAEWVRFRRV